MYCACVVKPRCHGSSIMAFFPCVHHPRGLLGFYLCLNSQLALKHLILHHVSHLGLIVSWKGSQRGQCSGCSSSIKPFIFICLNSIFSVILTGWWATSMVKVKWGVSQGGNRQSDRQCQAELNQLRHIKSRIHAR